LLFFGTTIPEILNTLPLHSQQRRKQQGFLPHGSGEDGIPQASAFGNPQFSLRVKIQASTITNNFLSAYKLLYSNIQLAWGTTRFFPPVWNNAHHSRTTRG
jgi:hypothetical protein